MQINPELGNINLSPVLEVIDATRNLTVMPEV